MENANTINIALDILGFHAVEKFILATYVIIKSKKIIIWKWLKV